MSQKKHKCQIEHKNTSETHQLKLSSNITRKFATVKNEF